MIKDELGFRHPQAADKLDNVRSIADTLRHLGHKKTWAIFNATQAEQRRYDRKLAQTLLSKDPENGLFRTLHAETQTLFPTEEAL